MFNKIKKVGLAVAWFCSTLLLTVWTGGTVTMDAWEVSSVYTSVWNWLTSWFTIFSSFIGLMVIIAVVYGVFRLIKWFAKSKKM